MYRSVYDRLDAHPDLFFTRGEAWAYWQIEQVDPPLFERIRGHVQAGRWEIVGGWWIQPDCNLPGGLGMQRQIELGKQYFLDRFGQFPTAAYNVDSFGHAATLPTIMHAAGQRQYVMMRPQEHEMALPARLFRWRERAGAPAVVTFRVAGSYNTPITSPSIEHLKRATTELPEGVCHTMCFVGIGDHGGGPTERTIAWLREHRDALPGCRLEFSTVRRFFDSIADAAPRLPEVVGELQYHAVGCYTVHRAIKAGVRENEHLLRQAEVAVECDPSPSPDARSILQAAWRDTCFHQFHDTLGGTCLPSAYRQVDAGLGRARASADELLQHSLRRQLQHLPDDVLQRVALFNASDRPFDDTVEFEPWLDWQPWHENWRLLDEHGQAVPYQRVESEAMMPGMARLLIDARLEPGQLRTLRIDTTSSAPAPLRPAAVGVHFGDRHIAFGNDRLPLPRLDLIANQTDTWSHGVDRYADEPIAAETLSPARAIDAGSIMWSWIGTGQIGQSTWQAEYRAYRTRPHIDLFLTIHWTEKQKLLKLTLPLSRSAESRLDGIMGGELARPLSGAECPVRDSTLLHLNGGGRLGVVCPDISALDCTPGRLRLTLLRSPYMAHHDPHPPAAQRGVFADQGVHRFRVRLHLDAGLTGERLDLEATAMSRSSILAD